MQIPSGPLLDVGRRQLRQRDPDAVRRRVPRRRARRGLRRARRRAAESAEAPQRRSARRRPSATTATSTASTCASPTRRTPATCSRASTVRRSARLRALYDNEREQIAHRAAAGAPGHRAEADGRRRRAARRRSTEAFAKKAERPWYLGDYGSRPARHRADDRAGASLRHGQARIRRARVRLAARDTMADAAAPGRRRAGPI